MRGRSSSCPRCRCPASGCESSSTPCGGTVPHECRLGSISGASARGASTRSSSSSRSSRSSVEVGAEAGRGDDLVDHEPALAVVDDQRDRPRRRSLACGSRRPRSTEPSATRPRTVAPRAPRAGQLVVAAAAVACGPGASPRIAQTISVRRLGVAQRDEVEDRVERGVAAADDEHAPAGVALARAAEHVGDAVGDPVGVLRARRPRARRRRRAGSAASRCPRRRSPRARGSAAPRRPASTTSWNGASSRPVVLELVDALRA